MEDYTAYARWACAHLYALRRAGFSLGDILGMTPEERRELGAIALNEENRQH